VDQCSGTGVELKIVPPLKEIVAGPVSPSQLREVQIEDLLGREPVRLDVRAAGPDLAGKVVMITGAGGSIGSELARQVARFHPQRLLLLERAESPLYFTSLEVAKANPAVQVVPLLASVTNGERLDRIFEQHRPDVVFHAAAYKHVPMLEGNVVEGVWNNVIGTLRVARCAARHGARKFVLISTDKAVHPTSVLGVTKRLAERVVRELPLLRASATDFRVVRFGNVLGSDGSVVPLFQRQLETGGPLTVTHPEVRRYFMTISEAVQLVLEAAALPEAAGRIAILEMGEQVRILDLAEQMIRLAGLVPYKDVRIEFTGLRPGEKLEEELLAKGERAAATSVDKIRVVQSNGVHGEELARQLRQLAAVAARRDQRSLIRALTALVPDYTPEDPALVVRRNGGRHAPRPAARRLLGVGARDATVPSGQRASRRNGHG
jgi:FlaA1/EpsC-like NDP-sugar epimerase